MKILLVGINSKFIHSNLAIRYLKAYSQDLNYDCMIKEFSINDRIENVLEGIIEEKADVVAFSCYIWNMEFINKLAVLMKLVNPKLEILYGGPEVSYGAKEYLESHPGEYLIEGEGEVTFREFVEYKLGYKTLNEIDGIYYKIDNEILFNRRRKDMDMNDLIFPYEENEDIENKIVYYEASRGCPFKCSYCLSSVMHGVRFLDINRVKKELTYFMKKEIPLVKFVDRTFNCNKKFTKELLEFLIEQDTKTRFHFEIAADILTDEEIELLNKAPKGRFQLEIGVQTSNIEVLHNINRVITFENLQDKVLRIAKNGNVMQHLDLIAGLPGENMESFKRSFNDVHSLNPDEIQLGFLKLLKGSSMRLDAEKWGIVYSPYAPYEIIRSSDISYDELLTLKKVEHITDKYYNSGRFKNSIKLILEQYTSPFDLYYDLANYFIEKGYFKRSLSNLDYYNAYYSFFKNKINSEDVILFEELLKYDYLNYNNKKWIPEFLFRDITKEEERSIREIVKERFNISNLKKYHIEKFRINILKYLDKGEYLLENTYIIYDENNMVTLLEV
ncbi:B12-binding domain-containing radical SAM protein [Clostridium massiliamazoniense]|uniref:B12-binding domain-containing radical SAM protein n=1 Tax=Clostridium massiliamazoniense TaxID=1347366 RepID=UPI0006D7D0FF|nr:B12-binding domain-containing radical SAM protein [Clostridium massiliamazoniense]